MDRVPGSTEGARSSALWGKRSSGQRSSALWGKGGRGAFALLAVLALMIPSAGLADSGSDSGSGSGSGAYDSTYVAPDLLADAKANPGAKFNVIVQAAEGRSTADAREEVSDLGGDVRRRFRSITGVAARLSGGAITGLAKNSHIGAITRDARVVRTSYSNPQKWPFVTGVAKAWGGASSGTLKPPAIAVVDSGIESGRTDFSGRVVADVNLSSLTGNSPGDGRGHGTFVASIAAGGAKGYSGAVPNAPIVSIDVMDDNGMAMTRDVIAAADWILANKGKYNIRVANFSLHSSVPASFMYDPLDKAVQRLWFSGVVVVAAAGNYGVDGGETTVAFAPGNDPFIITVGAVDTEKSVATHDDFAAPWSAYGYTYDGFAKPELVAPGRYMIGAVPATSTMALQRPERIVAPGYMWMSGTSFAAPVVAGAAAYVLAVHPDWTPDQVKGALMLSARATQNEGLSGGVGEVHASKAAEVTDPPNPNLALNQFVVADPNGGPVPVFDAASWAATAMADASWASASWASASWASASWASASWASASWAAASWASASWAKDAYDAASWASVSYEDNAEAESGGEVELVNLLEIYASEVDMNADVNGDGVIGEPALLGGLG